jgi:hydrogenase expression/formation protein HypE
VKRLRLGKLPMEVLSRSVLSRSGWKSPMLATGPKAGLDFGAVKLQGGGFLLVSADPVTGVAEGIGRYAVNVSANDVATSGTRPGFMESVILLPEGATEREVAEIAEDMDAAAKDLRMAIVGGHTEVTPGLRRPIVVVTAFGVASEFVSADGAKVGDSIMMTKTAGLEGTAALAEKWAPPRGKREATRLMSRLSVVEEAELAFRTGHVHGMHDCTEGGVLGAVFEMSHASGVGFRLDEASVPVAAATRRLCRALSADPLKLIGSGALLISVEEGMDEEVAKASGATKVGTFVRGRRVLVRRGGGEEVVREAPEDELWRLLGRRL